MADWFIARSGQQQGPFNEQALRDMIANGTFTADDVVWREGLAQWTPARNVPELASLFAGGGKPETIAYSRPFTEGSMPMLTERALDMLKQTRPWVRLVAILIFIAAGLIGVVAAGAMIFGIFALASGNSGAGMGGIALIGIGLLYGVMAFFYYLPAMFLNRYASRINDVANTRREDHLEQALEAQKSFWKFVGVLILIMVVIWLVMAGLAIAGAVATGSRSTVITPAPVPFRTVP